VAGFDFDAARRWSRFAPGKTLSRRHDHELPFLEDDRSVGQALLLDTCVYIDQMQGRAPPIVEDAVEYRTVNHSTVAVQEMMHTVGRLDPLDPRTANAIRTIREHVKAMPSHRVFAPDADILGKAALLTGILCRLQGYAADRQFRSFSDCILFLQAQKLGLCVLTANIGDFDILLQLMPQGRVLFYRR
jgi:predicted nucleic acid-binding protein